MAKFAKKVPRRVIAFLDTRVRGGLQAQEILPFFLGACLRSNQTQYIRNVYQDVLQINYTYSILQYTQTNWQNAVSLNKMHMIHTLIVHIMFCNGRFIHSSSTSSLTLKVVGGSPGDFMDPAGSLITWVTSGKLIWLCGKSTGIAGSLIKNVHVQLPGEFAHNYN